MTQYIWIFVYKVLNMVCFLSQYIKYTAQTVFYIKTIIVFMFLNKTFININLKNINYIYKVYI
jgi:hypothetical protein